MRRDCWRGEVIDGREVGGCGSGSGGGRSVRNVQYSTVQYSSTVLVVLDGLDVHRNRYKIVGILASGWVTGVCGWEVI